MSEAGTLKLTGELVRERLAVDGKPPKGLDGITALDLGGVPRVDVAGIAYLADLVARIETASGKRPTVMGKPEGLGELARAYRIKPDFSDFP